MKRLWPTLLLVVICIGGFWYASSKDFFKEKKDEPKQVFTVKKEDVAGFSMQNGDSAIELQKKDNVWTMTKPSPIPLNDFSAESWIDSFNLTTKDKTVEDNPSDLAKYGLEKPSQKFTVTMKDGSSKVISVGDPVPIPGFFYALSSGSGEVFRLSEQQVTSLHKQQLDFMEKSPIHTNYDQVTSLSVDWKGVKWSLTKTETDKKSYDANWKIGDRELKGADASNVLDKAIYLATDQLVKAASAVKMDAPELRVEVKETDSGKETVTVYTGKIDGDNVWIAKQGGEWAYAIPAASMQELSDMGTKTPDQTAK